MSSESMTNDDILSQLQSELRTALEYGRLSSLPSPSDGELARIGEILDQATDNSILHFWLVEIDHFLGHHLGLLDEDDRESYKDQQVLIKEYLGHEICQTPSNEESELSTAEPKKGIREESETEALDEDDYCDERVQNRVYH
jgi:hypothetical protein